MTHHNPIFFLPANTCLLFAKNHSDNTEACLPVRARQTEVATMATADPTPAADPPAPPAGAGSENGTFDIVAAYQHMLADNTDLTKPVVAIKALIALLDSASASTAHEMIEILSDGSRRLTRSIHNPLPLIAGTQLFLWFTRQMLKEQDGNFEAVRQHLVTNGRLFAQRAINARYGVGDRGWRFVFPGATVLTHGASRAVLCLLERAQKEMPGRFKVIYVRDEDDAAGSDDVAAGLRSCGIPTSTISLHSVLYAMTSHRPRVDVVLLGAEVITQDGGVVSRMGTCQIAQAARYAGIDTYVCGETHKFCTYLPDAPDSLLFKQDINQFVTDPGQQKPLTDLVDYTVSTHPRHSCDSEPLPPPR